MADFEQEMKSRIEKELKQVKQEILTIRRESVSEELQAGGDNTPLTEDADVAQIVEGMEILNERQAWLFQRARALEDARRRTQEGTYGICTSCGKPISRKRLEAIPEASLCRQDQARMETTSGAARRPGVPGKEEWEESEEIFREKEEFEG